MSKVNDKTKPQNDKKKDPVKEAPTTGLNQMDKCH